MAITKLDYLEKKRNTVYFKEPMRNQSEKTREFINHESNLTSKYNIVKTISIKVFLVVILTE